MKPYYDDGTCVIYHGDCRDVLPAVIDADALITDPPYPGYDDLGWETPDVTAVLGSIKARVKVVTWPPLVPSPLGVHAAEHVWHKPNKAFGHASHQYERVLVSGDAPAGCKVFRIPAILPNYDQYRAECVDHPTQKPLRLIRRLVDAYARGLVLDPFMGSGTTLRAAKDCGFPSIGIEVNERYCEIAARRLAQEVLPL